MGFFCQVALWECVHRCRQTLGSWSITSSVVCNEIYLGPSSQVINTHTLHNTTDKVHTASPNVLAVIRRDPSSFKRGGDERKN